MVERVVAGERADPWKPPDVDAGEAQTATLL
jgi:hypothetical protein